MESNAVIAKSFSESRARSRARRDAASLHLIPRNPTLLEIIALVVSLSIVMSFLLLLKMWLG